MILGPGLRETRARAAVIVFFAGAALYACHAAPPVLSLKAPHRLPRAGQYEDIVKRWTRHQVVTKLEELNTTLRVYATFRSPAYNAAYIAKRQAMFGLPPHDVRVLRTELATMWRDTYAFVVAVATHDHDWNDLDRQDSNWRLALVNARGEQVAASTIERQRRVTRTDRTLLPHVGMFFEIYDVRFPKLKADGEPLVNKNTDRLVLRITGPLGEANLVWRIR